ncbi:MAG: nitroreductase family protein [Promethearchaeota archaeon]|jgi:nitroreductase/NAD-dependent dihydropyrimidine dehydrogenase PreA subunit
MPIIGIDRDKCKNCNLCVLDCPTRNFSMDETQNQVIFENYRCILCGHCIGVCPENAILYDNMEDEVLEYKDGKDPSVFISYEAMNKLFRAKRSVRQYKNEIVPEESIKKVINSMRYAPTGANMRNLKCLILSSKEKITQLTDSIISVLESPDTRAIFKSSREKGYDPIFYNAPHVLIIYSKNPYDTRNSTIAMTYGMLSAETLGLGTCWIGYAHGILTEYPHICKTFTGIETYVLGVMTLGYPAVKYYRGPPRPPIHVREEN